MKKLFLSAVLALALPVHFLSANLLMHLDLSQVSKTGEKSSIRDTINRGQIISVYPTSLLNTAPIFSEDVPPALAKRVKGSANMRMGNLWVRHGDRISLGRTFTVNFWINPNELPVETNRQVFIYRYQNWLFERVQNGLAFRTFGDKQEIHRISTVISDKVWQMVTLVIDRRTAKVYVDGIEVSEFRISRDLEQKITDQTDFFIGTADSTGRIGYDGLISDFAIFTKALSKTDISALSKGTHPKDI